MSSFQETLQGATEKERALSFLQNIVAALVGGGLAALLLFRPIPVPLQNHIPTLIFVLGILLTLWDEPVWNESLGAACSKLAHLQRLWPLFALGALSLNWWMAKDGSSFSSFLLAAIIVLLLRGKAGRKPFWILYSVGALLLLRRTGALAAALGVLAPFFFLVLRETVSRTKGRLDSNKKVWIPFAILLATFFQIALLTTAFQ